MVLCVERIEFFRLPMQTRFPFRYGIATLTELPHLFVRATVRCDGRSQQGVSADGLPPKWFTKDPETSFESDDLPAMLSVIGHAAQLATSQPPQSNPFLWWWQLYQDQLSWAQQHHIAPLLAGLGSSLIERAVLDACCRAARTTLHRGLVSGAFGLDPGLVHSSLQDLKPRDYLAASPRPTVQLRHTVGLGDPLRREDIDPSEDPHDGLPHSLLENIRSYGLKYFKIKLSGDPDQDSQRLAAIASLILEQVGTDARFTLDGNEQYRSIDDFRSVWERLRSVSIVRDFLDRCLLFVEQPLHRDVALSKEVQAGLRSWSDAPPIIIDESDAKLDSFATALRLGYSGTSHKNCKGIFKGLINAAIVHSRRSQQCQTILSAEDLANVGPVALLQDLAMVAALSVDHVERNGHHYFAGLSMYSDSWQAAMIERHGDLYRQHPRGFATLSVNAGQLSLASVNASPFGLAELPPLDALEVWDPCLW